MPQGQASKKVEALVQGVRMAKMLLKAFDASKELFPDGFTIGSLIGKLDCVTQTR